MSAKQYWFPAKKYGWGWGMPLCWQGWCVLAAYVIPVIAAAMFKLPDREPALFWLMFALQTLVYFVMCWWKGEPPQWRWGTK